jgi:quercetin dioxygenase-like cupin family protein
VPTRPYALAQDQGDQYAAGVTFVIKADEQERRTAPVMEYTTQKGDEPQPHVHATEDEMFYVLGGEVTFRCGGETFDVGVGGFVFLPRGIEHEYTIRSDGLVRLLVMTSPPRPDTTGWGGFIGGMKRRFGSPT